MECQQLSLRSMELLGYLWESISMCRDDCYISLLRCQVIKRGVLLDSKMKRVFLTVCRCQRIFSNVRAWQRVLVYSE